MSAAQVYVTFGLLAVAEMALVLALGLVARRWWRRRRARRTVRQALRQLQQDERGRWPQDGRFRWPS